MQSGPAGAFLAVRLIKSESLPDPILKRAHARQSRLPAVLGPMEPVSLQSLPAGEVQFALPAPGAELLVLAGALVGVT